MDENKDDFIISSDDITITLNNSYAAQDTFAITTMGGGMETITIPSASSNSVYTISGDTIDLSSIGSIVLEAVEWKDCFPDFHSVEKMCDEYPGLAKAFENFKTVYKMVEQDWKGKLKNDQDTLF